MKQFLYSVKDSDFCYSQPFVAPNDSLALRMFVSSVRSTTPNIANTAPEKKSLWKVGEFDDATGAFTSILQHLAEATTCLPTEEETARREELEIKRLEGEVKELEERYTIKCADYERLQKQVQLMTGGKKCKKSKK